MFIAISFEFVERYQGEMFLIFSNHFQAQVKKGAYQSEGSNNLSVGNGVMFLLWEGN